MLDMYKGVGKEQRDKVQLMAAERKTRSELEELRQQLKKIQESKREERKKLADEDAQIKIKKLEEQAYTLQRQVASQKQVKNVKDNHFFIVKRIYLCAKLDFALIDVSNLCALGGGSVAKRDGGDGTGV